MASRTSATFLAALLTLVPAAALAQGWRGRRQRRCFRWRFGIQRGQRGEWSRDRLNWHKLGRQHRHPVATASRRRHPVATAYGTGTRRNRYGHRHPVATASGTGTPLQPPQGSAMPQPGNTRGTAPATSAGGPANNSGGPTLGNTVGTTANGRPIGSPGSGPGSPEQPIDSKLNSKR